MCTCVCVIGIAMYVLSRKSTLWCLHVDRWVAYHAKHFQWSIRALHKCILWVISGNSSQYYSHIWIQLIAARDFASWKRYSLFSGKLKSFDTYYATIKGHKLLFFLLYSMLCCNNTHCVSCACVTVNWSNMTFSCRRSGQLIVSLRP